MLVEIVNCACYTGRGIMRRKIGPSANAMPVALAYPRIPINRAGKTSESHCLALAMAAAVVGPPTLAFDAKYNSRAGKRKIPRPNVINMPKWTAICAVLKANTKGALVKTSCMDPAAPEAAKNI